MFSYEFKYIFCVYKFNPLIINVQKTFRENPTKQLNPLNHLSMKSVLKAKKNLSIIDSLVSLRLTCTQTHTMRVKESITEAYK